MHSATEDFGHGEKSRSVWLRLPYGHGFKNWNKKTWRWSCEALEFGKRWVKHAAIEGDFRQNFKSQSWSSKAHSTLVKFEKMVRQTLGQVFKAKEGFGKPKTDVAQRIRCWWDFVKLQSCIRQPKLMWLILRKYSINNQSFDNQSFLKSCQN